MGQTKCVCGTEIPDEGEFKPGCRFCNRLLVQRQWENAGEDLNG